MFVIIESHLDTVEEVSVLTKVARDEDSEWPQDKAHFTKVSYQFGEHTPSFTPLVFFTYSAALNALNQVRRCHMEFQETYARLTICPLKEIAKLVRNQ